MSDAVISSLNARIEKLSAENADYRRRAKSRGEKATKLEADLAEALGKITTLTGERDKLRLDLKAAPGAAQAELDKLKGEIRKRDHRAAFDKVAGEQRVRPEALDDLWSLAGINTDGETVDAEAITGLVSAALEARPYLVQSEAGNPAPQAAPQQPTQLPPGPGAGRSGGSGGRFTPSAAQMADPRWMFENQDRFLPETTDRGW